MKKRGRSQRPKTPQKTLHITAVPFWHFLLKPAVGVKKTFSGPSKKVVQLRFSPDFRDFHPIFPIFGRFSPIFPDFGTFFARFPGFSDFLGFSNFSNFPKFSYFFTFLGCRVQMGLIEHKIKLTFSVFNFLTFSIFLNFRNFNNFLFILKNTSFLEVNFKTWIIFNYFDLFWTLKNTIKFIYFNFLFF